MYSFLKLIIMKQDLLAAFLYFTRLPLAKYVSYSEMNMKRATKFYPLVGWFVGSFSALVFFVMFQLIPVMPALILSTAAGILMTGALHEDGFSDTCDGFGGAWQKDKILSIMKDSRVGAYGSIGTILILFAKISFLSELYVDTIPFVIISAHVVSRFLGLSSMMILPYVRINDESSKTNAIIKRFSFKEYVFMMLTAFTSFLILDSYWYFLCLFPLLVLFVWINAWFKKWIGGYTGDCMGAVQQLAEVIFYLSALIIQKNII